MALPKSVKEKPPECRKCHTLLTQENWPQWCQRTSRRLCHQCHNDKNLTYCRTHKEKYRAYHQKRMADPEYRLQRNRISAQWEKENPERAKELHWNWRHKSDRRAWAALTRYGHQRRGFETVFTIDELQAKALATDNCWMCGKELTWCIEPAESGKRTWKWSSPTLNRLTKEKKLTLQNTAITCFRCNYVQLDFSLEEFLAYCQNILTRIKPMVGD